MTRFIHDQFAKKYLTELLNSFGEVQTSLDIAPELKQADLLFIRDPNTPPASTNITLVEKLAAQSALFEPFRNPVAPEEIRSCLGKLFDVHAKMIRDAKRKNRKISEAELPILWIICPTFSESLIKSCSAVTDEENYAKGVYLLPDVLKARIIAVHKLPKTPETLWLRILGRGKVQQQAIQELKSLSEDNGIRDNALELVYEMLSLLEAREKQELDREDKELIMQLSTIYLEKLENATAQGIQQGLEQGIQQGLEQGIQQGLEQGIQQGLERGLEQGIQRGIEQGLERGREEGIEQGLERGREEGIEQGLERGREEGIEQGLERGREEGIEEGMEQGLEQGTQRERRATIRNLLIIRFGSIDEELERIIESLTALPPEEFTPLLLQLSREDLLARFYSS